MSRRCRASLQQFGSGEFGGGCNCARTAVATQAPPCTEPLIYSNNLLLDIGDFGSSTRDAGPDGEDFPLQDSQFGVYWDPSASNANAVSEVRGSDILWAYKNDEGAGKIPELSNSDSQAGVWHVLVPDPDLGELNTNDIRPITLILCDDRDSNGHRTFVSVRVNPGDLVTMSGFMKKKTSGDMTLSSELNAEFIKADVSPATTITSDQTTLTTTYVKHELKVFAPVDSHYLIARYGWVANVDGVLDSSVFVDTMVLGMTSAAGVNVLLCAFGDLITIDNSTTETDFL